MPNWLHKLYHNLDSNWAPLFVVIVAGVPKLAIHPATFSDLMSTSGGALGYRVNRSKQVNEYLEPSEYGKGPTMLICTWSNLSVGSVNLPKTGLL